MCHRVTLPETNPIDRKVYKVVFMGRSQWPTMMRSSIEMPDGGYGHDKGEVLTYNRNAVVKSPRGPGIMAWLSKQDAEDHQTQDEQVIELQIPVGATVRYGCYYGGDRDGSICASEVKVLT